MIDEWKFSFDISNLDAKFAGEKRGLVYEFLSQNDKNITLGVKYSQKGAKTKLNEILKNCKSLDEISLAKALKIFEKQSNIDFFINKNAGEFLKSQLDLWIYQYFFSQSADFTQKRVQEIAHFKDIALTLIDFISQFENELAKIWNKPKFVLESKLYFNATNAYKFAL